MSEISNLTTYNATCGPTGNWSMLAGCLLVNCHPLPNLTNTAVKIEILETQIAGTFWTVELELLAKMKVRILTLGLIFLLLSIFVDTGLMTNNTIALS